MFDSVLVIHIIAASLLLVFLLAWLFVVRFLDLRALFLRLFVLPSCSYVYPNFCPICFLFFVIVSQFSYCAPSNAKLQSPQQNHRSNTAEYCGHDAKHDQEKLKPGRWTMHELDSGPGSPLRC